MDMSGGMDGEASTKQKGEGRRVAIKLKGYMELGKEELEKGMKAEEWGLPFDARSHYSQARRIVAEGLAVPDPADAFLSLWDIKRYREKMSTCLATAGERLQQLERRTGTLFQSEPTSAGFSAYSLQTKPNQANLLPQECYSEMQNLQQDPQSPKPQSTEIPVDELALKKVDPRLLELIESEILDRSPGVKWDDIAGLEKAKQALMEMVILPSTRSDLFRGLRRPARGLLIFGPPGNGKTMLAKAVASESKATFFNISASSLTSKWLGEGEKLVRALFTVATLRQPSIIFIDEIDSIMSSRSATEHEASRRLKSEFLVQFDGVMSVESDRVTVMGATNRPQELDDALRRRLVKRIYIPLPDMVARRRLLENLLKGHEFSLPGPDLEKLVKDTENYSGSDLHALCEEAAMIPIRELGNLVHTINADTVRCLNYTDFTQAMKAIRPSVSKDQIVQYEQWNRVYGSN